MLLYRTNLTLSATLAISNGLNLGTRSLAANARRQQWRSEITALSRRKPIMTSCCVRGWCGMSYHLIPKPTDAIPAIPSSFFPVQPCQFEVA